MESTQFNDVDYNRWRFKNWIVHVFDSPILIVLAGAHSGEKISCHVPFKVEKWLELRTCLGLLNSIWLEGRLISMVVL